MFRFGVMKWLIAIITFLLFAGTSWPKKSSSSMEVINTFQTLSKEDSLFIQKRLDELNTQYYSERNSGSEDGWDSMNCWDSGTVVYSNDTYLKAFSFTGDWMGLYPVPMSQVCFRFNDIKLDSMLYPIVEIHRLNDNKYLLIGQGSTRMSGWQGYDFGYEVNSLEIENSKITLKRICPYLVEIPGIIEISDGKKLRDVYVKLDNSSKILTTAGYAYKWESLDDDSLECYYDQEMYTYRNDSFVLSNSSTTIEKRQYN